MTKLFKYVVLTSPFSKHAPTIAEAMSTWSYTVPQDLELSSASESNSLVHYNQVSSQRATSMQPITLEVSVKATHWYSRNTCSQMAISMQRITLEVPVKATMLLILLEVTV